MSLTGGQSLVITTSSILMLAVGAAVGRWRVVALPAGGFALFLLWVALDTPGYDRIPEDWQATYLISSLLGSMAGSAGVVATKVFGGK